MPALRAQHSGTSEPSRLDIFDCLSIFDTIENLPRFIADPSKLPQTANFDYRACQGVLGNARVQNKFQVAQGTIALATVDPSSEGQSRFIAALARLGILVEAVDFRNASVTTRLREDGERNFSATVGPEIAYVIGLLAGRPSPEVVVVSRVFEVFAPLMDFTTNRGGKAAIAFFKRFMDPRFGISGLFEQDFPIRFIDLEPFSQELLGLELRDLSMGRSARTRGISGI